jgi:hypothetical protein
MQQGSVCLAGHYHHHTHDTQHAACVPWPQPSSPQTLLDDPDQPGFQPLLPPNFDLQEYARLVRGCACGPGLVCLSIVSCCATAHTAHTRGCHALCPSACVCVCGNDKNKSNSSNSSQLVDAPALPGGGGGSGQGAEKEGPVLRQEGAMAPSGLAAGVQQDRRLSSAAAALYSLHVSSGCGPRDTGGCAWRACVALGVHQLVLWSCTLVVVYFGYSKHHGMKCNKSRKA